MGLVTTFLQRLGERKQFARPGVSHGGELGNGGPTALNPPAHPKPLGGMHLQSADGADCSLRHFPLQMAR